MKIDNAQLAAFAAVLREGSFDEAARCLHVTPSAISQRIKQLEERLGQVVIERSSPCRPTASGKRLSRFAEQVALLETEMLSEMGASDAGLLRLPVAVNADSLDSWFLSVFDDYSLASSVIFDLRCEDQDHSAVLLREGAVVAAVSGSALPVAGCRVAPLGVVRYLAVASPAFVERFFVGRDSRRSRAEALGRAPMMTFNRKDSLQQRFLALLAGDGLEPPTHFIPSSHGFVDFARRGLAWGMVPEQFVATELADGTLAEIAPGRYLDVPLYWHRWRLKSQALDGLSESLHRAAAASLRPMPVA